jgi:hypothetical protein
MRGNEAYISAPSTTRNTRASFRYNHPILLTLVLRVMTKSRNSITLPVKSYGIFGQISSRFQNHPTAALSVDHINSAPSYGCMMIVSLAFGTLKDRRHILSN